MSTQALDGLVRSLHAAFEAGTRGARIGELLGDYARTHRDWSEFAFFSERHYTRNLVTREPRFELMILCWGVGQESPIHNHEGQDCWMAVLDGAIQEVRYPMPNGRGAIRPEHELAFERGQVAFIRDEMGLHLVRPAPTATAGGVTLHLYSSPYDACNCYCPTTGQVTRKRLELHSIRGRILPASA